MVTTITHSEICASAAGKLGKDWTAETVDKCTTQYTNSMLDLMIEKAPNNPADITLVQAKGVGYKMGYVANATKKNPDGTERDLGPRRTLVAAIPNFILKGINADLVKLVLDIGSALMGKKAA